MERTLFEKNGLEDSNMSANGWRRWGQRVAEWMAGKGQSGGKEQGAQAGSIQSGPVPTVAGETRILKLPGRVTMEMVWCPPGTFAMRSPAHEDGQAEGETQGQLRQMEGFWIAKYPVTQKQWKRVMGTKPSFFKGDTLPVEHVSWRECLKFCKKTGLTLPTEAQWEYACRAGGTGTFAETGELEKVGWFHENSGWKTYPVGRKLPNAWGLCDMYGNVWEWCMDTPDGWFDERIIRGGSCGEDAEDCLSACRRSADQDFNEDPFGAPIRLIGFRPIARQE
jgi:formylglycine-generating enzyme required for sulfatase activity